MHHFTLSDPWFDLVQTGKKIYEGRRFWEKTFQIKPHDLIEFTSVSNPDRKFVREVIQIYRFQTFEQALQKLGIEKMLPGIKTIAEGVEIYLKFVSIKTQLQDGIIIFELR